jgi:general secretion pathway protein K
MMRSHNIRKRGSILIYVVWAVMLLSLFAASVGSRAVFALGLTERLSEQLRASYIARGAAHHAALALGHDDSLTVDGLNEPWANSPTLFREHALAGGWFHIVAPDETGGQRRYGLTDEERRINLNAAPADVLQKVFEIAGGMSEADASQLAAAIEDWRDEDDRQRPLGAEGLYYRSLRDGYECKDGPLETMEELLLIRGVTPPLYRNLEPHLTVYGSGPLNLNTAGPTALLALGLSELGVDGLLAFRSGEDGLEGTSDDRRLASVAALESELKAFVPVEDLARLAQLAQAKVLGVGSTEFRALIEAHAGHASSQVQVFCVMDRNGTVKVWSER